MDSGELYTYANIELSERACLSFEKGKEKSLKKWKCLKSNTFPLGAIFSKCGLCYWSYGKGFSDSFYMKEDSCKERCTLAKKDAPCMSTDSLFMRIGETRNSFPHINKMSEVKYPFVPILTAWRFRRLVNKMIALIEGLEA